MARPRAVNEKPIEKGCLATCLCPALLPNATRRE